MTPTGRFAQGAATPSGGSVWASWSTGGQVEPAPSGPPAGETWAMGSVTPRQVRLVGVLVPQAAVVAVCANWQEALVLLAAAPNGTRWVRREVAGPHAGMVVVLDPARPTHEPPDTVH